MKDPTVPPVENRKKFMFYDTEQNQTKLKIRCGYDGMSQSQFFRMMILGYVEEDEDLMSYIKKCKEKYSFQGQQKRNKAERTHKSKRNCLFESIKRNDAMTLREAGDRLGISYVRVKQIQDKALKKISHLLK